jgi:HK97 family phage prohead protease
MIRFTADLPTLDFAKSDQDAPASISGIAVPWAPTTAVVSGGQKVAFARGAFDVNQKNAKLIEGHDLSQLRGTVNALADMEEGLGFTATFARTRASADAVELVKAGAYDAVSVGAEVIESHYDKDLKATVVTKASLMELSLVAIPAFKDALITSIAASAEETEPDETPIETTPTPSEEDETMSEPTTVEAAVATQPIYATAKREFKLPSPAEYIATFLRGGSDFAQMNENVRAAAPSAPYIDTESNPGALPEIIVQPAYNNFRGLRPVIDAIGTKAMPTGGQIFVRPSVTTHVSQGVQSAQNAALTADLDWTDPNILQLVLDDMGRVYANTTDNVAADALLAGCSQSAVLTDPTSPAEWISDIYDASSTILTNSNGNLPTHLFLSPNMWAAAGKLVDTTGRPLFSNVGPMNAYGSQSPAQTDGIVAFGLRVVVDRNFAADTCIVGDASGFEIFESMKGAISIDVPSTLSRTIAWRGYLATLMIDATKFVKLT